MNRRMAIAFMLLMVLILLTACSSAQNNVSDTPLKEYLIMKSIELTCIMDSLAQSNEYIELITPQSDLKNIITTIGADEYKNPNNAVLLTVSDAVITSILEKYVGKFDLPDDAYDMVVSRMCSSVPNVINSQQGVNTIATTSMLTGSKAFPKHKDLSGVVYNILIYDNYSSVTVFNKSVEGMMSASSTFLFLTDDMKNAIEEEDVLDYLSENYNITGVEIEYIHEDEIANYK